MTVHEYATRLQTGQWLFVYYDSESAALTALSALRDYAGVWRGLNPLRHDSPLLSALNWPLHPSKHRAGVRDIAARAAVLLDFDADCPSDVMSTDVEHDAAISQATKCRDWLRSLGWPSPKMIDSGRGCQLHARVNLPADSETDALIKHLLRSLKVRYPLIDAGVHDRARLARLPGFWNKKSVHPTDDRPWRMAKLLDPGDPGTVTAEQIANVTALIGLPTAQHSKPDESPNPDRVERTIQKLADYLAQIGIELQEIAQLNDGRTLLRLSHCPLNPEHTGSSAGIGVSKSGQPQRMCFHAGCAMPWSEWRKAVEKKYGMSMQLGGKLIFSSKRSTN